MAADASILEVDAFFKEAYLLPDIDGAEVLGGIHAADENTAMVKASLESQHKEAFDAYKLLFVKFKELVNTRKRVIAAEPVAAPATPGAAPATPGAAPAAPGAAPATPGAAAAPAINSHTKHELNKQYEKQLKELAASISDSKSLETTIKTSVEEIAPLTPAAPSSLAASPAAAAAAAEKIRRIFTEFLKIRVKGGLERGKFLMDELFDEPEDNNDAYLIKLKAPEPLSGFKSKYVYLKELYSEEDKKYIDNILAGLKGKKTYNLNLQYTLAKIVQDFIPFTQAGRLVKYLKKYIQSDSADLDEEDKDDALKKNTELRKLLTDVKDIPLLKKEVEKVDKYIKAVGAVEELRANKDDAVAYVQKRSVVNTLFTEKWFIEFFSKHLPEGFIEKLETSENYKELLKEAIYGEELKEADEAEEADKANEAEEADEADKAVKEARRGKVLYKEADDSYKLEKLGFFDKLAGKALSKKELAEWWKKRGGKFNIGQTIPEPVITIFTETFHLKKKSKKTVHFTDKFLMESVKRDDAAVPGAGEAAPGEAAPGEAAPGEAAPGEAAPGEAAKAEGSEENSLEVTAKGFANNGIYDQEDGPPISSIDVKSGTMFEMYYLGWLDKTVPPIPLAAAAAPAAAASSLAALPAASSLAASPAAAAAAAAAEGEDVEEEALTNFTPQQKKTITKMMKSLFSFVFSDIQVRDANKEKRFHDAYRIAYTVLEKHQKIPCKAKNPKLHKYFKKSLEYRKEIAIRELAATKMVGRDQLLGMQDHYKQLITGLSGLITFLDNAVEGQPCIVYGDTLSEGPVQVETGNIDTRYILQVFRNHIRMRRDGAPPPDKDVLMRELTLTGVPLEDIDAVYKQISDMLTDYAKLTKENPVLRDLVVLFSQIALYLQQLGNIRLELERLQHQMDKCADDKEKKRLAELLATRGRELADKEAEIAALNVEYEGEKVKLLAKIAELEEEIRRKDEDFEVMEGKRNDCLQEVARLKALIVDLEGRLAAAEAEAAKVPGLEANLHATNEELAVKNAELQALRAELAGAKAEAAKVPGLEANLHAANQELAANNAELQALRAELAGAEAEAAKVPGLNAHITELEAELQALRARLTVADEEAAKVPGLEANLHATNQELAAKKAELQALRAELAGAEAEAAKVPGLNARIAGLEDELARLRALKPQADRVPGLEADIARLRALKPQADRVPGLEADIARLEAEVARLRAQLTGVGGKAGEDAATIVRLQADLAALRAQLVAAIARTKEAEESLRRCGEENERLRAENDRLRRALDDCERQKAELEASRLRPSPPIVVAPPPAKAPPKLRKSTLKLIAGDIDELGPICFYVFFKTYLYHDFEGSSITATSYDIHGQIISTERSLRRIYDTKEFISMLYPKIFEKIHGRPPRGKGTEYSAEWKNTALWFIFHLIRRIGELYLGVKGVQLPKSLSEPATKINFDSVDKMEIKDYIIILFNELSTFLGIIDAASIRSNLLKKSGNLQRSLQDTIQQLYSALQRFELTSPEAILSGIENTCMRGLLRQLEEEKEEAARLGGGGGPRRPQIGGGRRTSVKSLSQGMLLLFLIELRKSKQLKSAKEVQALVNKAGKALDNIGQYELVLTILQEVMEHTNTPIQDGYTYVSLGSMKKEKANALIESYHEVFDKRDTQMFKTLGTVGSFHSSAPEEFEEVLGKGPFCLVLVEDKGEGYAEETPLHGVSDEYEVVLEEKERKVLEDNGIPLGGVIFLYLVCLNELYCDSSDEECIRPTR